MSALQDTPRNPIRGLTDAAAGLWAKSDPVYPLWCHLLDVAAVAIELQTAFPMRGGPSPSLLSALTGLHDVGKADPLFQLKAPALAGAMDRSLFAGLEVGWSDDIARFRHESRSSEVVHALLLGTGFGWSRRAAEVVARAVAGHHGNFAPEHISESDYPDGLAERWASIRGELVRLVLEVTGAQDEPEPELEHLDVAGVQLTAVLVAADWLASNDRLLRRPGPVDSPEKHYARARVDAREILGAMRFTPLAPRGADEKSPTWAKLFGESFEPRGAQRLISVGSFPPPGLVIIEASTGEGKTEAALYLSEQWQCTTRLAGNYIALPTQATSNDIHRRYRDFLARTRPGADPLLVHGMAWLLDTNDIVGQVDAGNGDGGAQIHEAAAWIRNGRRALLAPHAVGTIDQVLLAALAVRFGFLRLLGLGRKVLIVDEVHACDTFMRQRLCRVLNWCRMLGTPVILLSATLARSQREELVRAWYGERVEVRLPSEDAYPLVTVAPFVHGAPATDVVSTRSLGGQSVGSAERSIALVVTLTRPGEGALSKNATQLLCGDERESGCAAMIVNTVRDAQGSFRSLREAMPDDRPIILFHARFPAWRRMEIEQEVRRLFGKDAHLGAGRPERAIVVATQVLEQSLDVDFDSMVSAIAPIDALLQRVGRLRRHERARTVSSPARLVVTTPTLLGDDGALGASAKVYSALHLLRTIAALRSRPALVLPRDYRALIEQVYADVSALDQSIPPETLERARQNEAEAVAREHREAQAHLIGPPDPMRFRYPNRADPKSVDEAEEGEEGNNLRARTRLGDTSIAILAITRDSEREALRRYRAGRRDLATRRTLLEARVAVPRRWLGRDSATTADRVERIPVCEFDETGGCLAVPRVRFSTAEGVMNADE